MALTHVYALHVTLHIATRRAKNGQKPDRERDRSVDAVNKTDMATDVGTNKRWWSHENGTSVNRAWTNDGQAEQAEKWMGLCVREA